MTSIGFRKLLSVTLVCAFTCTQLSIVSAQQTTKANTTGVIAGSARSAAGAPLSNIKMEVVDASGKVTGSGVTAGNGGFSISDVPYGAYTVQCVGEGGRVLGTSRVNVSGAATPVRVTCSTETPVAKYPPKKKPYALLAGLGAAAVAIGAVAIVANGTDASGSR